MHSAPHLLSALTALQAIEEGSLKSEHLVRACLDRVAERDQTLFAFATTDASNAVRQARKADAVQGGGRLRGLPFAAKDVLDSVDLVTSYGSPIYSRHRPVNDASCIAATREAGGILLGKTATCEFATLEPCATRNPHDCTRTPGGSSSGSAAAVADFMVPMALGTQTTASIIRPAAYCGVVGYKPSFDLINPSGLKHVSPSLDTIGLFTRTVADAQYFALGQLPGCTSGVTRFGVCLSSQWEAARSETTAALDRFAATLRRAGAALKTIELPERLASAIALQTRLSAYEARQSLAYERIHHHTDLSTRLQRRLEQEAGTSVVEYLSMLKEAATARQIAADLFADVDVLIYPAAEGEAEVGVETGSPRFGGLWTLLRLPTLSLPIGVGPSGMPMGVQLVGGPFADQQLFHAATFAEREWAKV